MAVQSGYNGSVTLTTNFDTIRLHATSFTFNVRNDLNTYETFASNWKSKALGTQDVAGSVSGLCDDGGAFVGSSHGDFTKVLFKISYGSSRHILCTAVCTNVSISKASPGAPLEMSFDFESSGAVTIA